MGLEYDLNQFTGTTQYRRNPTGLLYTDGIQYLAEQAGAYWLIDLVGSYQPRLRNVPFQLWNLNVAQDRSGVVTMREDTGRPELVRQDLPYTDFPLRQFSFYTIDKVMLLKNEY